MGARRPCRDGRDTWTWRRRRVFRSESGRAATGKAGVGGFADGGRLELKFPHAPTTSDHSPLELRHTSPGTTAGSAGRVTSQERARRWGRRWGGRRRRCAVGVDRWRRRPAVAITLVAGCLGVEREKTGRTLGGQTTQAAANHGGPLLDCGRPTDHGPRPRLAERVPGRPGRGAGVCRRTSSARRDRGPDQWGSQGSV